MVDRYTKAVLTVIAVCLLWLCLWGTAPKWGTPAAAESGTVEVEGTVDVNIREVDGRHLYVGGDPSYRPSGIPVTVEGGSVTCK